MIRLLYQWRNDLDNMHEIGIDTVIFIRGGFEDKSVFLSKVLGAFGADDFAGFIFEETSKRNSVYPSVQNLNRL